MAIATSESVTAKIPPTPLPEIVAALKRVTPLHGLAEQDYEWLARHGMERIAPAGSIIFHEGDPADHMTILLRGEIHVRRERGGPSTLLIGRSGQITGLLPFSRMKRHSGLGLAATDLWALLYDRSLFPEMLAAIPGSGQRFVSVLLDRVREVTRMEQQAEKLAALGKLAGNLAHELNNPASAAQRAAAGMLEELRIYGREKFRLGRLCLDQQKSDLIVNWQKQMREAALRDGAPDQAGHAEREDALARKLEAAGISQNWQMAPELAELGVSAAQLEPLRECLDAETMRVVLSQFASSLRAERIAEAMLNSTARIFELMQAIKDYSYLDQAPIQEVDIRQGIESTLSMLQSRMKAVEVARDYDPELPRINAYASELNQVWTALIENSLDAMADKGNLKLKCRQAGEFLVTEVWDDGPGIPAEIQSRIFEPFFTTKAPGQGLGLGLDTAARIVGKHRGFVTVHSKPGSTCFQVRLPIEQLQAY